MVVHHLERFIGQSGLLMETSRAKVCSRILGLVCARRVSRLLLLLVGRDEKIFTFENSYRNVETCLQSMVAMSDAAATRVSGFPRPAWLRTSDLIKAWWMVETIIHILLGYQCTFGLIFLASVGRGKENTKIIFPVFFCKRQMYRRSILGCWLAVVPSC